MPCAWPDWNENYTNALIDEFLFLYIASNTKRKLLYHEPKLPEYGDKQAQDITH